MRPLITEAAAAETGASWAALAPGASSGLEVLRSQYPARRPESSWPRAEVAAEEVRALVETATESSNIYTREAHRRGTGQLLNWLVSFPGRTWPERWKRSAAEQSEDWRQDAARWLVDHGGGSADKTAVNVGCAFSILTSLDVLRPSLAHLLQRRHNAIFLTRAMERIRDPEGFSLLRKTVEATPALLAEGPTGIAMLAKIAAAKGGAVADVTVGDCVEAYGLRKASGLRGTHMAAAYTLLRRVGTLPADAPVTFRALTHTTGQRSVEAMLDRYAIACKPIRDLILDYLRERQLGLDYATLDGLAFMLGKKFWADLEEHHPGIDSLHLSPEIAAAWKERCRFKIRGVRQADGTVIEQRVERLSVGEMTAVRAFYQDIAQWALEEPARWGPWVTPCPIRDADLAVWQSKENKKRKARMDQRTRERLPVLPVLVKIAHERLEAATRRLRVARGAGPGEMFEVDGQTWQRAVLARDRRLSPLVWAVDPATGNRRDLATEEDDAFWAWAIIETLRHTGIRVEELMELTHHAITEYRLPSTGELVPLLQIAPSKSDAERLLLIGPELADVLSAVVQRVRSTDGMIPLVTIYDRHERTWLAPMPLLFQRRTGSEDRGLNGNTVGVLLNATLAATGLADDAGELLRFTPHDFRRIFITDAIMNGLPPHIAQVIAGHENIETTMRYKAVYPQEAIEAYRAFIGRRRADRPSAEYRTPTEQEWDEFLAHFEKRKLSVGICARAFGTACIHEHACIRCSLLRPDPAQRPRLVEIRSNLRDRITEAEREGWLGEIEGLQISLTAAEQKITQIDVTTARHHQVVDLGIPSFRHVPASISTATLPSGDR